MDMIDYLKEQLDETVEIKPFKGVKKLPLFLTNEYKFSECKIHDLDCILMEKEDIKFSIDKIIKHLKKVKEFGVERPVLIFNDLDSGKRRKLVIRRVPFIVPGKHLYLPFIFINFTEKVTNVSNKFDKFTAATQMIYIRILLSKENEIVTREIGEELGLSMMTINRGIRQLVSLGIVEEIGLGTKKKYYRMNKKFCWEAGKKYMIPPISKVKYLKHSNNVNHQISSSDLALSALTMMSSEKVISYALDKYSFDQIEPTLIIKESDVEDDMEAVRVERWKYNPNLFSKDGIIDVFSLYAIYQEDNDPRVEIELEQLIEEALCED
ncbi:helix-turn-helix domain-containing protein [Fusibacter ferrireducens]|uniref:hypothetical protein n=1 Tax=Fusibacter ferrireducens TaxID=2785058 RepID=UPI001A9BDDDE|nr:hypothetical protein [Fusibacter ferrireducens]